MMSGTSEWTRSYDLMQPKMGCACLLNDLLSCAKRGGGALKLR